MKWYFTKCRLPSAFTSVYVLTPKPCIMRYDLGMALSDIVHMNMCVASVWLKAKSQKLLCAVWAWGTSLCGSGFPAWMTSGNFMASWMKKTGMLFPTMSQFPSLVYSFTANPRTSRTVSALPRLPNTVEKRTKTSVSLEVSVRTGAKVRSEALS